MVNRMNMRLSLLILSIAAVLLFAGCSGKGEESKQNGHNVAAKSMSWDKMPEMMINLNKSYSASFHTSKGVFKVKLYADEAPVTVNNFLFLAREGFYDGQEFHSIIESFMIQTGDPNGNGTGTPGYSIPDELDTGMRYEEGIVAMANAGKANSGGSQFFICVGPDAENLNKEPIYTIFGKVESGMEVVQEISKTPVKNGVPLEKVIIESIVIHEI